jgi:tetratricopeptide (TPR) repeat protein
LGQVLRYQGKYAESEKLYRQAVKAQEEHMSKGSATAKDRQGLANSYSGLGIALAYLKREQEAEGALRQALEAPTIFRACLSTAAISPAASITWGFS